jgi:hypothetical protein
MDDDIRLFMNSVCELDHRARCYDALVERIERLVRAANDEYSLVRAQEAILVAMTLRDGWKVSDVARIGADQWRNAIWFSAAGATPANGCVVIARVADTVGIRDAKCGFDGPVLEFAPRELELFIGAVKDGDFDRLLRG